MSSKIKVSSLLSADNLQKPFQYGWKRENVYAANQSKGVEVSYISPAGKRLRTKHDIELNLQEGLHIGMFTFTKGPLGVDDEIVRIASGRGYRKPDKINASVLGELTPTAQTTITNNLVEVIDVIAEYSNSNIACVPNSIADCSSSNCRNSIDLDTRLEKYALMDIDQLRRLLIQKDNVIEDLQKCLKRCKHLNKKRVEEALLQRIERKATKRKLLTLESLDDSSRAYSKKMRKIVL